MTPRPRPAAFSRPERANVTGPGTGTSPLIVALAALALLAPAAAAAPPAPAKDLPRGPAGGGAIAFERLPAGPARLIVTFADRPGRPVARARLGDLGPIVPVVPEAGVWALTPAAPAAARERALRRAGVEAAEWSMARRADDQARPPTPPGPAPVFIDPFFTPASQPGQFGATTWGAELTTVGPRAPIAILDSGVDATHEEWRGPASPLIAPRSTLHGDGDASDHGDLGHGTHVAGIAAAPANGVGIVGVAPAAPGSAPVIPVQIADPEGNSTDDTMMRGIRHAVLNGARVINISAGGPGYSQAFQDTILWASARGALVVASVGNQGQGINAVNFPAGYHRVLGVGAQCGAAITFDCPRAYGAATFSNHNRTVDVIAPGVDILSSVPTRVAGADERVVAPGYALKDGTSMAAPFVTGVAALIQAANGNTLTSLQVLRQIRNTATDTGARGRDQRSGYGVVNPRAAVTLRVPAADPEEVNDDIKWLARSPRLQQNARVPAIRATLDRDDDPDDVYAIRMARGERLRVDMQHPSGVFDLYLWGPGTRTVSTDDRRNLDRHLVAYRPSRRTRSVVVIRVTRPGVHYVNVFARRGTGPYTLRLVRQR